MEPPSSADRVCKGGWITHRCHLSATRLSTVSADCLQQSCVHFCSALLAWLLDGHLFLVAVRLHLLLVEGGETCHALGFSLAHSVLLEATLGFLQVEGDQIGDVFLDGPVLAVDDRFDGVLGGTRLALELSPCDPALSEARVVLREAGHFFPLFQVCQVGHHFHEQLDGLELRGFLGGGWEGFVDRFVGDRVEEFAVRPLEGTRGNAIVVDDGVHFGSANGMEGFCGDTEHLR